MGCDLNYKQKIDWNTDICFLNSLLSLFFIIFTIIHVARYPRALSIFVSFKIKSIIAILATSSYGDWTKTGNLCESGYQ